MEYIVFQKFTQFRMHKFNIPIFWQPCFTKKKQNNHEGWKQYVSNQRRWLHFVTVIHVFRFAQELDHRVSEQALFDIFNQCKDGKEKRPDTHFLDRREYFFGKNDITDKAKSNQERAVQERKKDRMNPEWGSLIEFQLDYLALKDIIYGLTQEIHK